jgi:plastocyanin
MKRSITIGVLAQIVCIIALCLIATALIGACGVGTANAPMTANQVHMATHVFTVASITINKGESVTLVNDSGLSHIVLNGSWVNGQATPLQEAGAPTVSTGQIPAGGYVVIGPFDTAGTYQVYCSLHLGMNLAIIVN